MHAPAAGEADRLAAAVPGHAARVQPGRLAKHRSRHPCIVAARESHALANRMAQCQAGLPVCSAAAVLTSGRRCRHCSTSPGFSMKMNELQSTLDKRCMSQHSPQPGAHCTNHAAGSPPPPLGAAAAGSAAGCMGWQGAVPASSCICSAFIANRETLSYINSSPLCRSKTSPSNHQLDSSGCCVGPLGALDRRALDLYSAQGAIRQGAGPPLTAAPLPCALQLRHRR